MQSWLLSLLCILSNVVVLTYSQTTRMYVIWDSFSLGRRIVSILFGSALCNFLLIVVIYVCVGLPQFNSVHHIVPLNKAAVYRATNYPAASAIRNRWSSFL